MKPLGVGLVFSPQLLPLLGSGSEAASVLEIEPQTLWQLSRANPRRPYWLNRERLAELVALPQAKLIHSVGLPVGGARPHEPAQLELVREMADVLQPAWVSDHLSFNAFRATDDDKWVSAGFFLPPEQVPGTVALAAQKLGELGEALGRPVAFETGVNYLSPRPNELGDGDFFRSVAETADCGILLDLHNVWTNGRNRRESAGDTLARLPLERVWEVHLAGGMELDGYWLDAHSGAIPEPVLDLAAEWIPHMPNLGALVFEILDEHIAGLGLDGVERQLERMHGLWRLRSSRREIKVQRSAALALPPSESLQALRAWEDTLGGLVIGRAREGPAADRLRGDPGLDVLRQLVADSRAGFVSQGLRHTMTLLLATFGGGEVRELLAEFMRSRAPELFVSAEADAFADFLKRKDLGVPYLREVLAFEHALIRAVLYGEDSDVMLDHEPGALFEGLEQGALPNTLPIARTTLSVRRLGAPGGPR